MTKYMLISCCERNIAPPEFYDTYAKAWELDYAMRMNDEQEIEFVNDEAKALAVVRNDTATIDIKCRGRIEMFMFRTC